VVLEHRTIDLKLSGPVQRLVQRQVLATSSEPRRASWDATLHVLANALEVIREERHTAVTLILGNSLVRYALVPKSNLLSAEEESGVLRHYFQEIYGEAAEQWELRVSPVSGMTWQPASGVERALLDGLRALFPDNRLRLRSMQPRLMSVCNEHCAALGRGPAWLLLVEPGNLCLGLIAGAGLTRLRSLRIDADWAAELPGLLDREACLAELDEAPGDVLLWSREGIVPATLAEASLRVHLLQDSRPVDLSAGGAALALAGG
jgi:hypothetical protein